MEKITVVTGAAGGLGRAIVARLIADGCHVVGMDVNEDGLSELAGQGFTGIPVDLKPYMAAWMPW